MKYMFLIYSDEKLWTAEEREACMRESMGIGHELATQGKYITSAPLQYVSTATTVRVRNGEALITAGPFAETTEQLGGFYILELENLDEAMAVACRLPPAKKGTVEIRPLRALDGLPVETLHLLDQPAVDSHGASLSPFLLLCYDDEEYWTKSEPEVHRAALREASALAHELASRGQFVSASPLHAVATATSICVRQGQRIVSDGPFAETREVLGGYYLILAHSQQEALDIAARHSGAHVGAVEVRPLFDVSVLRQPCETPLNRREQPVGPIA